MAHDAVLDAPAKLSDTTTPKSDALSGSTAPSAADVKASSTDSHSTAQGVVDQHFGGLMITNADQINLCHTLSEAPKIDKNHPEQPVTESIKKNPTNGNVEDFKWDQRDGHGYALSVGQDGKATECIMYKNGTTVSASGDIITHQPGNVNPIKPNDIQVVSNGGKIEYTPGPQSNNTIAHETDPQGHKTNELIPTSMKQNLDYSTKTPNLAVTWQPYTDGVNFTQGSQSK